jgi:hypothetical protein
MGTWNTSAKYKDVRVESGGRVVYASDVAKGVDGWQTQRGAWALRDGAYQQNDNTVAFAHFGQPDWKDVTITAKARKLGGAEGFLIVAGWRMAGRSGGTWPDGIIANRRFRRAALLDGRRAGERVHAATGGYGAGDRG